MIRGPDDRQASISLVLIQQEARAMFGRKSHFAWSATSPLRDAVNRSHAIVEFAPDGTVLTANETFLKLTGYALADILGRHHSMFVVSEDRDTPAYLEFWTALCRGNPRVGEFRYLANDGGEVWLQASFSPLVNRHGKVATIIQIATDITFAKRRATHNEGQIAAISRTQAVIEFALDGTIIDANDNFLKAVGYKLNEIKGRHHSMFVGADALNDASYRNLWECLNRGEPQSGEFKRIGKGGKEIWILASYNPILDEKNTPRRVVKFATDITAAKLENADYAGQMQAISKSQAVIEFDMSGTVRSANDNFLKTLGYTIADIKGRHHSMFVLPDERSGSQYREFWAALNRGEFQAGEYKRIGRDNREIWIQATYNPIFDLNGKPFKVVKYATDITPQVIARMRSERVRTMMESVAAGAEELNASVLEISQAMAKSKDTASTAVVRVEAVDSQANRLSSAANAMSGIVELIDNITSQINLLALNATIESARAGDAGRGFAVVASEVKNLAGQAKQATDKIGQEIANLTEISADVVGALSGIRQAIQEVSEYVTSTAAAVEEQSAVTTEMSSSMQRAAQEASQLG